MKKAVAIASIIVSASAFALSLRSQSVTSSTAATNLENLQTQQLQVNFPTMKPFPTLNSTNLTQRRRPISTPTAQPTTTGTPQSTSNPSIKPTTQSTPRSTQTPSSTATPGTSSPTESSYTDQVISLVNQERAKVNLPSLTKNTTLTTSAQKYAEYMAESNFFSHTGLDNSTFITRNKAAGYTNYRWMGENIAAGQHTPTEVMNAWMNSSGHKANILNTNAKEIGVGYFHNTTSKYKTYWVQEFGAQ